MRLLSVMLVLGAVGCGGATEPEPDALGLVGAWDARIVATDFNEANPNNCAIDPRRPASAGCIQDTMTVRLFTGAVTFSNPQAVPQSWTEYDVTVAGVLSTHRKPAIHPPGCSGMSTSCWQASYPAAAEAYAGVQPRAGVDSRDGLRLTLLLERSATGVYVPSRAGGQWSSGPLIPRANRIYDSTRYGVVELRRR